MILKEKSVKNRLIQSLLTGLFTVFVISCAPVQTVTPPTSKQVVLQKATDYEKLIGTLKNSEADGYASMKLNPGDIPGALNWCWNDRGTTGQDCGWGDPPYSFMSRHDIIVSAASIAVGSDCKLAGQTAQVAAKCQCHNQGVAAEIQNNPGLTCTALRRFGRD